MKNFSTFIYYGVIIDKNDYENLTKKYGLINLYSQIFEKELSFKDIGEVGSSWKQVIGKEITYDLNNVLSMEYKNNNFYLLNDKKDINLSVEEENEVKKSLISLGITKSPAYHIFTSWESDDLTL